MNIGAHCLDIVVKMFVIFSSFELDKAWFASQLLAPAKSLGLGINTPSSYDIGLTVKEEGRTGFSKGWQGCSEGFPEEQPCQPEENPPFPSLLLRFTFYLPY